MGLTDKHRKIKSLISKYVPSRNQIKGFFIYIDVIWAALFYGGAIDDYFYYQFYHRKHSDRKNFIVWRKRRRIINTCNEKADRQVFNMKPLFHKTFSSFLGRDWLDMTASNLAEFEVFVARHKRFFVKPIKGAFGKGVRIQGVSEQDDLSSIYDNLKNEKVIIEEVIEQHQEISEFNSSSVNTLRVVTLLRGDGTARVMTANFRCGNGERYADNFHHNGIAATIDIPTGTVVTTGIGMDLKRYVITPSRRKQL